MDKNLDDIKTSNAAQERLNQRGDAVREYGKATSDLAQASVRLLAERLGKAALGAAAVLWLAWFFLPALSISIFGVSRSFTFWDLLGASFGRQGLAERNHGLWALVGLVVLVGPIAAPFLRHPRARLLNAAPLGFLVLTAVKVRWGISSAVSDLGAAADQVPPEMRRLASEMARTAAQSISSAISLGWGAYVMAVAAIVLALQVRRPMSAAARS
jgi:hypothetical protein